MSTRPAAASSLTDPASLNPYQYAHQSPLRYIDPQGAQEAGRTPFSGFWGAAAQLTRVATEKYMKDLRRRNGVDAGDVPGLDLLGVDAGDVPGLDWSELEDVTRQDLGQDEPRFEGEPDWFFHAMAELAHEATERYMQRLWKRHREGRLSEQGRSLYLRGVESDINWDRYLGGWPTIAQLDTPMAELEEFWTAEN